MGKLLNARCDFLFIHLTGRRRHLKNIRFAFPSWQKVLQTFCIHMVFLRLLSYVVLRVCKSNCFGCKSDLVHLCTCQRYECLKCVRQRERNVEIFNIKGIFMPWVRRGSKVLDQKFLMFHHSFFNYILTFAGFKTSENLRQRTHTFDPQVTYYVIFFDFFCLYWG